MTDQINKAKQALIQKQLDFSQKETARLQKYRLLYTEKRSRLGSLTELRRASGGDITSEEQKLSKHVALYESKRSGMWDLAKEINQEEQSLETLKSGP